MKIGDLALQGDFFMHGQAVKRLGHDVLYIKDKNALEKCDKLIIPGGESTTFLRLIEKLKLRDALVEFGRGKGVLGTCAGLITLASRVDGLPFPPLSMIDIKVQRNAYGRQIDSFVDRVSLQLGTESFTFEGVFIRAPKIIDLGKDVQALGWHKNDTVMAANHHILVSAFHPELSDDLRVHDYFINHF